MIRSLSLAFFMSMVPACPQEPAVLKGPVLAQPEFVYVPAENYKISVEITAPAEAVAGEWVTLRATRSSGPWKLTKSSELAPGSTWFIKPPPENEREVADNLRWLTEPPGVALFDVPAPFSRGSSGHERKVMFSQPGTYRLWGENAYPTAAKSNVVVVNVRAKK